MIKSIYRIEFSLASGLSVGSGWGIQTDNDVIKRTDGKPFIPGTSLAGVYRNIVSHKHSKVEVDNFFGNVSINKGDLYDSINSVTSKILVYDADVYGDCYGISIRDSVSLDDGKVSIDGAKYDFEVVNAGTKFVTYFEVNSCEKNIEEDKKHINEIINAFHNENIMIGGKTTRGLGNIKNSIVKEMIFYLPDDVDKWIEFDMYDDNKWETLKEYKGDNRQDSSIIKIHLSLKQSGGILIRQYSGKPGDVCSRQLENYDPDKKEFIPIIPGTSWAGAFRHRAKEFAAVTDNGEKIINELFGNCDKDGGKKKSNIYFSESYIKYYTRMNTTRNAVDRFTGGTINGALYTESVVFDGDTTLDILLPKDTEQLTINIIAAVIADLQEGFLAVGGENSIGRGIFKITGISINKKNIIDSDKNKFDIPGDELFQRIIDEIKEYRGQDTNIGGNNR